MEMRAVVIYVCQLRSCTDAKRALMRVCLSVHSADQKELGMILDQSRVGIGGEDTKTQSTDSM